MDAQVRRRHIRRALGDYALQRQGPTRVPRVAVRDPLRTFRLFETKRKRNNIKLYVRRMFIMDDCDELMSDRLNFDKGVVGSVALPSNFSRKTSLQTKIPRVILKNLVQKCLEMLAEITGDEGRPQKFYELCEFDCRMDCACAVCVLVPALAASNARRVCL